MSLLVKLEAKHLWIPWKVWFFPYIVVSLSYVQLAIAQPRETLQGAFKFRHFTSANGLSQRSVMAILQDRKGYLWFGTRDGLNKFDGNKFIVYRHNPVDSTSLSNNNIHTIYEDSYGGLWVGTHVGLNKYDPKTDRFIHFEHIGPDPALAADHIIRGIAQISENLLWAATDNGILQINLKTDEIKRIKKEDDSRNSLSDNKIRYFLKVDAENIWILNTRYIDVYNLNRKTFQHIDYPRENNSDIHLNDLPTLYVDQKKNIWLGHAQGLALFDRKTHRFVDFEFQHRKPITSAVRSICEDLEGNLWIGSYAGLYLLNAEHSELRHIVHDENNSTSLSQNSIYKIIRDSRGDMWLGTWADGLNYYNRDNSAFKRFSFGNTTNKLNYRVVSGMAEDRDGNLWIGTEGGGLNFYDKQAKEFRYYKNNPNDENSISANNVKAVIIDRNQHIWIGIHDGGLNFLDPSQTPFRFRKIDFSDEHQLSLKAYKVLTLLEDRKGNIWIGTLTGGLFCYDVRSQQLSKIDEDIKSVMSVVQTPDPNILLFGGDRGLETIHIETKKKEKVLLEHPSDKSSPLNVNCLFIDQFGNYWIGTEGQGAYMYDPKRKKSTAYGTREGLPNDIIYGILPDNSGNIWMSTNNGISQLNMASGSIKNYNQSDGLQGNEFNYGSFYRSKDGKLFFGGTNGLTYFNPNDIRKNTVAPNIDITHITVNNKPFRNITDSLSQIVLKYNENNFSIDFTALSYMQPEKNQFAYLLEGNDKRWNDVGNQRTATYTNIKPGRYIFRVRGSNNDGVWNEEGDSIIIKVLPAPWLTWQAYLLYVALIGAVFLYIRKLILARVKERKEKEKSEQINQLRLRLFTDVSHEFRTPLTLIVGPLEKMVDQNLGDDYMRKQHEIMLKNARMLLQLINQILDFRKSEDGKLVLQASKSNIVSFVADVKKSFDALAEKKGIHYQFIASERDIQVWFDKAKLKNILFNLLSNAFKFSRDRSELTIQIATTSKKMNARFVDCVEIGIINFGYVIPEADIDRIFDQFYQLDHEKRNLGSGIGLTLTKRLVELHQGEISVKSSAIAGTRFDVLLPLGRDHLSEDACVEEGMIMEDDYGFALDTASETSENQSSASYDAALQNLLIVEDNGDLLNFLKDIFVNRYNIFVADNGEQAIGITRQHAIDLIISDIQMPLMDGFELCHRIKTTLLTSHIPVILLTAKTSSMHQEKGYYVGADAYITKPFNVNILEIRIANLLKAQANLIRKLKQDIILEPKQHTITSPDELFLEHAISTIEQNLTNPDFNTSIFIEQMNMSRTVIYTKLKALTGQNISTFIRTIRLKKASLLLMQTQMNISQIAYEVGFNDLKYFRDSFKEFFGMTPSEYKKEAKRTNK